MKRNDWLKIIISLLVFGLPVFELNNIQIFPTLFSSQIMVGGSTRIPAIRNILEMKFGQKKKFNINPDEAVVLGAAILADAIEVGIIILRIFKQNSLEEKANSID